MNHAKNRSRARLGGLLALALGVAALLAIPVFAAAQDGNDDGIPDHWEKQHHLPLGADQSRRDQDHDGLTNRAEFRAGDNPRDDDSDGDGVLDGNENAGTISAFDAGSGKLTIALFGGDSISGMVGSTTRIRCEDQGEVEHHHHRGGDRARSGETEPGDDHGGRGEAEPGDDHGGEAEPGDDDGDNSGPGSSNSGPGRHDDNGAGANCTTSALVVGAVVQEADLELEHGVATFDEVELAH